MQLSSIITAIESVANPAWQASWDKSGLQVTSTRENFSQVVVCLDGTPEAISDALAFGADFILTHHPLSLKPGLPNERDGWYEALRLLFCANVPLYAAHTSLDVNLAGPAGWLGRELGLAQTMPLQAQSEAGRGFGQVGVLPTAVKAQDFVANVLKILHLSCGQLCGNPLPGEIRTVAYCGGSGGSLLTDVRNCKADIYITGDIRHHAALDAASYRVAVLDVGHHSLEEEMMRRLAAYLTKMLAPLSVLFQPSVSPFHPVCLECGE